MPEWPQLFIVTVKATAEEIPIRIVVVIVLKVNNSLKNYYGNLKYTSQNREKFGTQKNGTQKNIVNITTDKRTQTKSREENNLEW